MTRKEFIRWAGMFGLAQSTGLWTLACESRASRKSADSIRVLVVGAGMAGISAAYTLREAGYEVVVLEARKRIGGRIWTDRSLGVPIDMGASWIHGSKGNPLTTLTKKYHINTVASDTSSLYLYDHKFSLLDNKTWRQKREMAFWYYQRAYKLAYQQLQDTPMTTMLEQLIKENELSWSDENFLRWRLAISELSEGTSLANLSTWHDQSKRFKGEQLLFPGGYDQLVKKLAQGLNILLDQPVRLVEWSDTKVKIHTRQHQVFEGDFAIITLPLGVLKQGTVTFDPVLPHFKKKAINSLGMGLLNKVILKFDQTFWKNDRQFISHLSLKQHPYNVFMNWGHFAKQPVLIATAAGKFGKVLEEESLQSTKKQLMATLLRMFGASAKLLDIKKTHWGNDPYSLGAYSHLPVGVKASQFNALASPLKRLYFAGEATHHLYLATVHGAYLSGKKAAQKIIIK